MSARRRHVFVEKVLKKLFPDVPSGQEKGTSTLETPQKKVTSEKAKHQQAHRLTDGGIKTQPGQRVYTASLPPEGYVPCLPETGSCRSAESTSSGDDAEDMDPYDQPKRRRIRKHKSKKKMKNPSNDPIKQAELEKEQSLLQEKLQPQHASGPTMSKNKKRKLKKKQQIRKKKATGFVMKASGVSFTYQPEESGVGLEGLRRAAGEAEGDPSEEGTTADSTPEDAEITSRKADGILSFLKSTQEMYLYDGVSKDSDSVICMEAAEELFHSLESHSLPPSDVFILDHMKTLLLLQDTERLKSALEVFTDHCTMPPGHARAISDFFKYWITHVLPEKK